MATRPHPDRPRTHTAEEFGVLGRIQNSTLLILTTTPLGNCLNDLTRSPRADMHPRMGHRPNNPDLNGPIDRMAPTVYI